MCWLFPQFVIILGNEPDPYLSPLYSFPSNPKCPNNKQGLEERDEAITASGQEIIDCCLLGENITVTIWGTTMSVVYVQISGGSDLLLKEMELRFIGCPEESEMARLISTSSIRM